MKRIQVVMLTFLMLLTGCGRSHPAPAESLPAPPFQGEQLYALAFLGWQADDIPSELAGYLGDQIPDRFTLSQGETYLVIPRYPNMSMTLVKHSIDGSPDQILYEAQDCRPFLIQCNVSDIFPDATICLDYQGDTTQFTPFLSLKDGSVQAGDRGLDLTSSEMP